MENVALQKIESISKEFNLPPQAKKGLIEETSNYIQFIDSYWKGTLTPKDRDRKIRDFLGVQRDYIKNNGRVITP
jgi:hypothetical protein